VIGRESGTSVRAAATGTCDACGQTFEYRLIHNGFNDSAYAYCDRCGCAASLNGYYKNIPPQAHLKIHGPINPEAEALLQACSCGGTFRADAAPRCPHCKFPLSAEGARSYIEANAPGTAKGWRWQRSWKGLYSLIVEDRWVQDNWLR
jgi:uncharacterized paraquat-inducible protein A